jgi:hypothetical protein
MRALLGILILIVIAAGGYYWLLNSEGAPVVEPTPAPSADSTLKTYSSPEYGIEFRYPSAYQLEERDGEGSAQRRHHILTLIRTEDLPAPQGGEGPPSITIEMFQNDLDDQTTEGWIRNSSSSNFKLSLDNRLSTTTIAGQTALAYTWDGLYRGDTIAIARPTYVYAFSVTYREPEDPIRSDFEKLMRTVVFK